MAAASPPQTTSTTSRFVSAPSSFPPLPMNATAAKATAISALAIEEPWRDTTQVGDLLTRGEIGRDYSKDHECGNGDDQRRRHATRASESTEYSIESSVAGQHLLSGDDNGRTLPLGGLRGQFVERSDVLGRAC